MNKETEKYSKEVKNFFQNKKVQNVFAIVLFLGILFLGASLRTEGLPNLIDSTTGDYTPLALDPYYFLRHSETLLEKGGVYPEVDNMRYQALSPGWSQEILPASTVTIYKVMKLFNSDTTLNFANVLNPVIFFVLGLIIFAFLIFVLTKNKWISVASSFILAVIPPYLYRTMAGFSDHESIGMVGFFLALLFFLLGLFYIEKKNSKVQGSIIFGVLAGISTMFAIASWGGGAKFLFMILPISFFVIWLTRRNKPLLNYLSFYFSWVFLTLLSSFLFRYNLGQILKSYMLNSTGILTLFLLGYIIIEIIFRKTKILEGKRVPQFLKENKEIVYFLSFLIVGGILYQILIGNFFHMIFDLISRIIYPFGTERVGITVAENKQPYLNELIGQIGKIAFYTFLLGSFVVGGKIASGIKTKKLRPIFTASFAFFILGILFSRVSQTSIFNGTNPISKAFFFISFLTLAFSSIYIYRKSEWNIETKWIFIAAWMIPMLLAVRSAIRVFFAIVPFIAFMIPLTLKELFVFGKKHKDDFMKFISLALFLFLLIGLIFVSVNYIKSDSLQAKNQFPSYNSDWQKAMSWVRENTAEGSVFLHWWDYGYWVQTGGNRPTVTDGGHFNGFWDHLIGRYVLTTPYPETAKSFAKFYNVSYLLIDPTEIGKYSAYSSIGDDEEASDRASYIATFVSDPKETQETRDGVIRLYRGGIYLDEDLIHEEKGKKTLLPKEMAGVGGVAISKINDSYSQPLGLYVYQGLQYELPIRYLYINGELMDFEEGVNATVFVYSNVINSGQQIDAEGALMYLSSKTKDSLVAKLYLMDDPENEYEEFELVHSESAYPFFFNYGGFRGPIKIWKINEMPNILEREEFTRTKGEYGEFDDLVFTK